MCNLLHPYRQLRAFALDPSMAHQIESYKMNEVTIKIPDGDVLEKPDQLTVGEWKAFLKNLDWDGKIKDKATGEKLWIQYTVR